MKIINNCKIWVVILIFIIVIIFCCGIGIYNKYQRYITQDMECSICDMNYYFKCIGDEIRKITLNEDETYIDFKDVNCLMTYNRIMNKEIFNLKRKCLIINSKLGNKFQNLWDNLNCNEEINRYNIESFFEQLYEKANNQEYVLLNDGNVNMFQSILDFYNNIQNEINKLINDSI